MDLYFRDIYGIMEAKLDEMVLILEDLKLMEVVNDGDGLPKVMILKNLDQLRSFFIFYNTEKHLTEDKKLKVSAKCQKFLEKIWGKIGANPNTDAAMTLVEVSTFLEQWKVKKENITIDALEDARLHGIVGEVIVGDANVLSVEVNYAKIKKLLPNIRFMNRVLESNKAKSAVA
jgi:hypothetical protein